MINDIINLLIKRSDFFLKLLLEHLKISVISILIAIIIGLIIGILISEYKNSSKVVLGFINIIYTIPSISLLGFLIPLSGIGNTTAIIALSIYALLPMVRNTYTGIINIDKSILEAAKGMGSTNFQILYKIKLPLAFPVIMTGIRSMVTMTIALSGIASFIGAGGLGVAIYRGITTNNSAMTIAGSLLIALLAIIIDLILGYFERSVRVKKINVKKEVFVSLLACLLVIFISIYFFKDLNKNKTINIATKPMTEQYIIGEMLKTLIEEETPLNVNLTLGVGGGTSNIQVAMEKGEFDIYPEYTGTAWNMVLKNDGIYNETMFNTLEKEYKSKFNFSWLGMYGFNNTYGLALRRDIAEQYNIKTYSDLAKISNKLTFGSEYDFFEREDGFTPLCTKYGYNFKNTVDLDIGLKYQAINNKSIDVMNIFTTDGSLSKSDVVVLVDDKNFYPSYMCGNVIRDEVLDKHKELLEVFKKLDNFLTDDEMAKLNYDVESNGREARDVAISFLRDKKIIK